MENKIDKTVLDKEIAMIKNENIRDWTKETLENVPEYFWRAWASSTGKYHPICTCRNGGLLIHVKRAVYFANRLCEGMGFNDLERDIVLSSVILHDIAKVPSPREDPKITYADYENHPINAEKYFADFSLLMELDRTDYTEASHNYEEIRNCIRNHMGRWSPNSIKKPYEQYSKLELIVFQADYLAATKDLITPVDNE